MQEFTLLMSHINDTNTFIEVYKGLQNEYIHLTYYKTLLMVRAYEYGNRSLIKELAAQIDKINQRECLQQFILSVRDVEVIHSILQIFNPSTTVIHNLIQYWLYVYEEYYDFYLTNIWQRMRPEANSMENILKILDMLMSIHKPVRLEASSCIGHLFIGRHYDRMRRSWLHVFKQKMEHKLIRPMCVEEILYLIDGIEDSDVLRDYLKTSKIVVPKIHSVHSIYLKVHKPTIEYTKKIWERIGLSGFNSDMVA